VSHFSMGYDVLWDWNSTAILHFSKDMPPDALSSDPSMELQDVQLISCGSSSLLDVCKTH
jgi:hypothetical protein